MNNWKTAMCLDLFFATTGREQHDHTVQTLKELIEHDKEHETLWRGCLAKYQEARWDL